MAKHKHGSKHMEFIAGLLIIWALIGLIEPIWCKSIKWIVDKTLYTITGKHHDIWEN